MPRQVEAGPAEKDTAPSPGTAAPLSSGDLAPAASVTFLERRFPIKAWDDQSIVVAPCDAECKPNDLLSIRLSVPLADAVLDLTCDGYVIRTSKARQEVVLMLSGLSRIARAAIAKHITG